MGVPARLKSRAKLNLSQRRLNFWTEAPMLNVLRFWVGADSGQDPKGLSAELPQCFKGHSSLCRGTPALRLHHMYIVAMRYVLLQGSENKVALCASTGPLKEGSPPLPLV